MKIVLLLFMMLQAAPKPKPTITSEWHMPATHSTPNVMVTTGNTWASALTTPTMVIHYSGATILEINSPNGKKLKLSADGKVTGDLPHDQAADNFWKAIATVAPNSPKCKPEAK